MRIRGVFAAVAVAMMLAACGGMSGPTTEQPSDEGPRPEALRTELDAQIQDPCFRRPDEMVPRDCQKYITQLTSTPESASKLDRDDPALQRSADTLRKGIRAYRGHGCTKVTQAHQGCAKALTTVADGLRTMRQALDTGTG